MSVLRIACPLCPWALTSSPYDARRFSMLALYAMLRADWLAHMRGAHPTAIV